MPRPNPWLVVALLWPVALLNYLDRQMLSTVRKAVIDDPLLNVRGDEEFAYLMAAFMWVYGLLSPLGGWVGDRFARKWTVVGSLLAWSAVTWATGRATSYEEMLALRALMGVSEAFYIPAALALISDFHPARTRGRAVAVHQTGIYAGLALGGVGGFIAQAGSWRDGFVWFGAVGVAYSFVLAAALRDAPRPAAADAGPAAGGSAFRALGREPAFWLLVLYFTLPAIAGWGVRNWLPTYLADRFQLDQGPAGLSATGYVTLAQFVGAVGGGWVADWWAKRAGRGRIFASAAGAMLIVPALLGLGFAGSMEEAIGWMLLFGVGWGVFDANNMPILCQIARPEHRATGYGVMNLVSITAGGGATVVFGRMRDAGVPLGVGFAVSAGIALLAVGLILMARPRGEQP